MKIKCILLIFVLSSFSAAQTPALEPPLDLDVLMEGIGNPILKDVVPTLTKEVQLRGINFDIENHLTQVLRAGLKGKREADEMAALVIACLRSCQECRARRLDPMTKEELKSLKRWRFSDDGILYEARIRGVKDVETTDAAAKELQDAGFNKAIVDQLVPDDKIPVPPLGGYTQLPLKRASEYDASAPQGWLRATVKLPAKSQSEFMFKHNGLFVKATQGGEPQAVSCAFNKPAPRETKGELVELKDVGLEIWDEKHQVSKPIPIDTKPGTKSKDKPRMDVSYLDAGADGRNAFRIALINKDPSQQQYTFFFYWQLLKTPKTSSTPSN